MQTAQTDEGCCGTVPIFISYYLLLPHELFLLQVIWLQLFCSSEAEIEREGVLKL